MEPIETENSVIEMVENNDYVEVNETNSNNKSNLTLQLPNRRSNRTNKQFKAIHWNCNSLKNKVSELKQFLRDHSPDIMSLNEIKCCNQS